MYLSFIFNEGILYLLLWRYFCIRNTCGNICGLVYIAIILFNVFIYIAKNIMIDCEFLCFFCIIHIIISYISNIVVSKTFIFIIILIYWRQLFIGIFIFFNLVCIKSLIANRSVYHSFFNSSNILCYFIDRRDSIAGQVFNKSISKWILLASIKSEQLKRCN